MRLCSSLSYAFAANLFHWAYTCCSLAGRQLLQCLHNACKGQCGTLHNAYSNKQHNNPLYHTIHIGVGMQIYLGRRAYGICRANPPACRKTYNSEYCAAASSHNGRSGAAKVCSHSCGKMRKGALQNCLPGADAPCRSLFPAVHKGDSCKLCHTGALCNCAYIAGHSLGLGACQTLQVLQGGTAHNKHRDRYAECSAGNSNSHLSIHF